MTILTGIALSPLLKNIEHFETTCLVGNLFGILLFGILLHLHDMLLLRGLAVNESSKQTCCKTLFQCIRGKKHLLLMYDLLPSLRNCTLCTYIVEFKTVNLNAY